MKRLQRTNFTLSNILFHERIREIRDLLSKEVPENFSEEINHLTLESAAVIALDKQLGLFNKHHDNSESKLFFKSVTEYFTYLMELELKPSLWKYYKTPTMKKLIQSLDHVTEITSKYIEEAIVRIDKDADKSDYEKSVVEKLIQIDKKIAVVMDMDILAAGVHTVGSSEILRTVMITIWYAINSCSVTDFIKIPVSITTVTGNRSSSHGIDVLFPIRFFSWSLSI